MLLVFSPMATAIARYLVERPRDWPYSKSKASFSAKARTVRAITISLREGFDFCTAHDYSIGLSRSMTPRRRAPAPRARLHPRRPAALITANWIEVSCEPRALSGRTDSL